MRLDAGAVERLVAALVRHVVGDQPEVARVDRDAVHAEDGADLVDDRRARRLDAVELQHRVDVVRRDAVDVDGALEARQRGKLTPAVCTLGSFLPLPGGTTTAEAMPAVERTSTLLEERLDEREQQEAPARRAAAPARTTGRRRARRGRRRRCRRRRRRASRQSRRCPPAPG